MDKNMMILIGVASVIILIIGAIVLWLLLRKKTIFAERIYASSSIKDSKNRVTIERMEIFNMNDVDILKDAANITGQLINISFGGEIQIKRIILRGISGNTTVSLYKLNGESPFSYTFTEPTPFKEFSF